MSDIAIRVERLSKRYRIGRRERHKDIREAIAHAVRAPLDRLASLISRPWSRDKKDQRTDDIYIWALKDVSLEVKQAEVLGIIGPNGAGKSTLLKILSRITEPTQGRADIRGRVGSLLEVGTGFHPELTGRENIYLNGAILGMRRAEINRKFDEIVDFSGVEKFIDTPIRHYSSGMHARLAFAVAAHLDPEVLLVDEVLAVGDAAFQSKCLGKMSQVASGGRTVVFVSHNMAAVRNLCSQVILLDEGRVRLQGAGQETIQAYLSSVLHAEQCDPIPLAERRDRSGSGTVRVIDFHAQCKGHDAGVLLAGLDGEFIVSYAAGEGESFQMGRLHVAITVIDMQGDNVFSCTTKMTHSDFEDVPSSGRTVCRIGHLPLMPGPYRVNILLKDDRGTADSINGAAGFRVIDGGEAGILKYPYPRPSWGSVFVPHQWEWLPSDDRAYRRHDGDPD